MSDKLTDDGLDHGADALRYAIHARHGKARVLTLRERLVNWRTRVRDYLSVLWRALKGEDPYDMGDW